jgi:heme exporter protein D
MNLRRVARGVRVVTENSSPRSGELRQLTHTHQNGCTSLNLILEEDAALPAVMAAITANLLQEPIFLLSGFYFPVKQLGFWVAAGASLVPLTLGLDAMRQLLFPTDATFGFLSVGIEVAVLVGLSVVFIATARLALGHMERLARREGRLTERRR